MINTIINFIFNLLDSISIDILLYAGVAFEVLLIIFFIIKSSFAYEMRMVRKLFKINNWLNRNKTIDQNNLLEFNNIMKHTPKLLRYHWHQYMLYRDKEPSNFMSTYNLVEKPLKTSSYLSNLKTFKALSIGLAFLVFVLGIIAFNTNEASGGTIFYVLSRCLIAPLLILILYVIISMIMRSRQNANINTFYQYMHYFERFMNKAVTTMPEYVDFEVLFTRKEIRKGIPVLNEYLEKRARQEQEELEKARLNAVEHEQFDFNSTGIDGSLVLERAIKETETYLNIRTRLLSEIDQLEEEIESIKRNYENTQKDYQKKMQVSKENVDRLRKQQEETTNRIESNYIKKQQGDEIKKQEQLEKDNDNATIRFNQEMEGLSTEIDTRRKDLEEKHKYVEEAMKAEYQTFSTKMFKSIQAILEERNENNTKELVEMKDEIVDDLQKANLTISEQQKEISELKNLLKQHNIDIADFGGFHSQKLQAEAKKVKRGKKGTVDDGAELKPVESEVEEIQTGELIPLEEIPEKDREYGEDGGFFDKQGYYRYTNGTYFDPEGKFFDEFGGYYEADGETYHEPEGVEQEEVVEEEPIQEEQAQEEIDLPLPLEEVPEKDREYGEDGGFFDKQGYYRYTNGTYFDPEGKYFDEYGGYYEADGETYHEPEGLEAQEHIYQDTEQKPIEYDQPVPLEDIPEEDREYGEDGGFFDKEGYYRYANGAYFDTEGRYFDEFGGYFEADGETYHEPEGIDQEEHLFLSPEPEIPLALEFVPEKDREYGEDGGFFDKQGFYRYTNGSYFDSQGRFFDEFGGFYEADGKTYHEPENYVEEEIEEETPAIAKPIVKKEEKQAVIETPVITEKQIEETPAKTEKIEPEIAEEEKENEKEPEVILEKPEIILPKSPKQLSEKAQAEIRKLKEQFSLDDSLFNDIKLPDIEDEEEEEGKGHFDENGNLVYEEGYYDKNNNFHDNQGGWFDAKTKEYHSPEPEKELEKEPEPEKPKEEKLEVQNIEELQLPEIPVIPENSEPPKRKAGRPRKVVKEEEVAPKKPRGRPKKVKENTEQETPKRKVGRPKKEKITTEPDTKEKKSRGRPKKDKENITKETPKRKAGRPKKDKTLTEPILKNKKYRGRPKKVLEEKTKTKSTKEEKTKQTSKGRGRPRKEKEVVKTKKGRGRPKKEEKETSKPLPKIKRTRGRPKKQEYDELEALNQQIETENKKLAEHQEELDAQINQTLFQLDNNDEE